MCQGCLLVKITIGGRMRLIIMILLIVFPLSVSAGQIEGVNVPESLTNAAGTVLKLQGTGIRRKFVIKVYLGQLYLENPSARVEEVIADSGAKRISMYILYKKIGREKLVEAWNEGFTNNSTLEQYAAVQSRIETFNSLFIDVAGGDEIILDYLPGRGTRVSIGGRDMGLVPGKDFNDALLRIWLGPKPVTEGLKKQLLGMDG